MKKIKLVLNSVAILVAIGGAFASRLCQLCEDQTQYIPVNDSYQKAGEFGSDYNCAFDQGACTFYYSDSTGKSLQLLPCREGRYTPIVRQ